MQNSFRISMYPYPSSTFCYQGPQYGPPTYVPCVFCHSTIPSASMAAHLAQCPNALAAAPPTSATTPFGSTQSVQYRRVVRVERKTVNERDIQPIPIPPNPPVYAQDTRRVSVPWNSGIPEWAIEDGGNQSVSMQTSSYQKPLPPVPQQSQGNRGGGMQRGGPASQQTGISSINQQQTTSMQTMREQGVQQMQTTQQPQAVPMQRPQVIQRSAQQVIQRNTQIPGQVSTQPRPANPRPVNPQPMQQSGNMRPVNQPSAQQPYQNSPPVNPRPVQPSSNPRSMNQPSMNQQYTNIRPMNQQPVNQQSMNPRPVQQSQRSVQAPSSYPSTQQSQPVGEVETINPGSLSDRIKMFESKTSKSSSASQPQQTTRPQSIPKPQPQPQSNSIPQSQSNSIPQSRSAPQPQSIPRPQPQYQPHPPLNSRPQPQAPPAVSAPVSVSAPAPQRTSVPSQPTDTSFASSSSYSQRTASTPTPQPSMKERTAFLERAFGNPSAPSTMPSPPISTSTATASSSGLEHFEKKSEGTAHPNKLKMPQTVPGQLSLAEMLQKRQMNGSPHPRLSSTTAITTAAASSTHPSSAVTRYEEHEKRADPKPLMAPTPIPGQKSLQEIMAQRTEMRFTDGENGEIFHQQTQTVQQTVRTSIPLSENPVSAHLSTPSIPPPSEPYPSSPVITFEDKEMQEMQEMQERERTRSAQPNPQDTQRSEETAPTSSGQPLYTASGVFVVELSKEDMKLVFSGDSALPFNGYSNAVMCIYPDQICFYYYNETSSSYQFIVHTYSFLNECIEKHGTSLLCKHAS